MSPYYNQVIKLRETKKRDNMQEFKYTECFTRLFKILIRLDETSCINFSLNYYYRFSKLSMLSEKLLCLIYSAYRYFLPLIFLDLSCMIKIFKCNFRELTLIQYPGKIVNDVTLWYLCNAYTYPLQEHNIHHIRFCTRALHNRQAKIL